MKKVILLSVSILLISSMYSFAEVPCKINYQGRLIKDNVPVDGTKKMRFSIYAVATGGSPIWTSGDVNVEVHNGLFRYVIGSDGGDLSSIDWTAGQALYLEVKVGTDILTPREELYAYPYAINSHLLEGKTKEYFINTSGDTQTKQGNLNIMGKLGIGTTGPGYKLDVAGDVRLTGNLLYGDSATRTYSRDNIGLQGDAGAKSGFYQTSAPAPAANWYPGASSWQHYIDVRHSNSSNNYALQIAGSFYNQELYFRKTIGSPTTGWNKFVYQNSSGNVGIGTTSPGEKLTVAGTIESTSGGVKFPDGSLQATAAEDTQYVGTVIYDAVVPITWAELDISSIVGQRSVMVFLRVRGGGNRHITITPYADREIFMRNWGVSNLYQYHGGPIQCSLLISYTDAAGKLGIVSWAYAAAWEITLIAYFK